MTESGNLLPKLHDPMVDWIPQLNKFPRDQDFVLGGIFGTKVLVVHECRQPTSCNRDERGPAGGRLATVGDAVRN